MNSRRGETFPAHAKTQVPGQKGRTMKGETISFDRAYEIVTDAKFQSRTERIRFDAALGMILAEDVLSDTDVPPFDKSMMDGYACRYEDIHDGLEVIETIQAGSEPARDVGKNQCSKIMTGAKMPEGADCVLMVEHTEATGASSIRFTGKDTRRNIAYRGEDIRAGEVVIRKGTAIKPAHVAVLALSGNVNPLVRSYPSVGIVSTGSELVEPGGKKNDAGIINSNSYQLASQVRRIGIEPAYYGIARDTKEETSRIVGKATSECDLVLVTGGVSMGDFDFVPAVLENLGFEIVFDRVEIKPGKPTTFCRKGDKVCFALPGNPVSAYIIFEVLAKPLVYGMMGSSFAPDTRTMKLGEGIRRKKTDRDEIIPVKYADSTTAIPVEYHGSGHIHALAGADGMTLVGRGVEEIAKGTLIHVRPI